MTRRVLIIGPPGCGKTTFGLALVEQAISKGIPPARILYSTFTRAGAYHARSLALSKFTQYSESDFPYFRTLHSIAFRKLGLSHHSMFDGRRLKEFAKTFNYKFSDDALDKDMFQQAIIDMGLGTEWDAYLAFDEWRKNRLILDFDEAYREFTTAQIELSTSFGRGRLKSFLERKDAYKAKEGLWEFSDLLLSVYQNKEPLDVDLVVIDESQDNSPLLHAVADIFSQEAKEVYLIGDPDQCIYGFMGSEPSLMINWPRDEDIVLSQSYRCSRAVHELSRKVVDRMKLRYHSDFKPTDSEGVVNKTTIGKVNLKGNGLTFLAARTRYLLEKHYEYLLSHGIPFSTKRGRNSPLDKTDKDIVLTLARLMDGEQVPLIDIHKLAKVLPQAPWISRGAKADIQERAKEEPNHLVSRVSLPALGFTTEFVSMLNDKEYLEPLKFTPEVKQYFRRLIGRYGRSALVDEPKLVLGTCHSFKGLECDTMVYDLELTRLPYENLCRHGDEEHRVAYVAITRARNQIMLCLPETWRSYPL